LLLDEPFAALDAESTPAVRGLLDQELQRCGITAVLVTHSLPDAWQLADRCAVMVDGKIVEETTPGELARTPRSRFGAVLADFAVLDGIADRDRLRVGDAWVPGVPDSTSAPTEGAPALGIVAPGDVELLSPEGCAPPPGVVAGVVETVEVRAGSLRVGARGGLIAEVAAAAFPSDLRGPGVPRAGQTLWFRPRGLRLVAAGA
jgi:molybdate transport system ATP-binding protein